MAASLWTARFSYNTISDDVEETSVSQQSHSWKRILAGMTLLLVCSVFYTHSSYESMRLQLVAISRGYQATHELTSDSAGVEMVVLPSNDFNLHYIVLQRTWSTTIHMEYLKPRSNSIG